MLHAILGLTVVPQSIPKVVSVSMFFLIFLPGNLSQGDSSQVNGAELFSGGKLLGCVPFLGFFRSPRLEFVTVLLVDGCTRLCDLLHVVSFDHTCNLYFILNLVNKL